MKNKVLSFQTASSNREFIQEASAIFSEILSQFNLTKRTPRERVPWRLQKKLGLLVDPQMPQIGHKEGDSDGFVLTAQ